MRMTLPAAFLLILSLLLPSGLQADQPPSIEQRQAALLGISASAGAAEALASALAAAGGDQYRRLNALPAFTDAQAFYFWLPATGEGYPAGLVERLPGSAEQAQSITAAGWSPRSALQPVPDAAMAVLALLPDDESELWSLAYMAELMASLAQAERQHAVLFCLADRELALTDPAELFIAFPDLVGLLVLDFPGQPLPPRLVAETGSGRSPYWLLDAMRSSLDGQRLQWRESWFNAFFMRLGLLAVDPLLDALLNAGLPGLLLRPAEPSARGDQAESLEASDLTGPIDQASPERGLVEAMVQVLAQAPSHTLMDQTYLRFPLFNHILLFSERQLLLANLALVFSALLLLLGRWQLLAAGRLAQRELRRPGLVHLADPAATGGSGQPLRWQRERMRLRQQSAWLSLAEAALVVAVFFVAFLLGRFLAGSLQAALQLVASAPPEPGLRRLAIMVLVRGSLVLSLFFLLYGLLDVFRLVPHIRRSSALQTGAALFLLNGMIVTALSFEYSLFFLIPAVLLLTAGQLRPLSLPAFIGSLFPFLVFGLAVLASFAHSVFDALLRPSWQAALVLSLLCAPYALWLAALLSRRDRFQRGSRILLLLALLLLASLVLELVLPYIGNGDVLPHRS